MPLSYASIRQNPEAWAGASALAGGIVWLALGLVAPAASGPEGEIGWLLALAVLVTVPLALGVLLRTARSGSLKIAVWAHFPAAALAAFSLYLPSGTLAALLTLPWLGVTLLVAWDGGGRLLKGPRTAADVVPAVGMALLPAGALWLLASRAAFDPGGFGTTIVLLTAVHFHYTAFLAPVWAGALLKAWRHAEAPGLRELQGLAIGLVAGTPLVAAGFTLSPLVEIAGVLLLAFSALGLGLACVALAVRHVPDRTTGLMLGVSGGSLAVAMLFALLYGVGAFAGTPWLDVGDMVPVHGWVNGVGFALWGFLGWRRWGLDS